MLRGREKSASSAGNRIPTPCLPCPYATHHDITKNSVSTLKNILYPFEKYKNKLRGEWTLSTERPPLAGEVNANFSWLINYVYGYNRLLLRESHVFLPRDSVRKMRSFLNLKLDGTRSYQCKGLSLLLLLFGRRTAYAFLNRKYHFIEASTVGRNEIICYASIVSREWPMRRGYYVQTPLAPRTMRHETWAWLNKFQE
jgi:hypothetical protein